MFSRILDRCKQHMPLGVKPNTASRGEMHQGPDSKRIDCSVKDSARLSGSDWLQPLRVGR